MKTNITVSVSININALKEKVWEALVDPAQIKKYLFGTDTHTTWQVGTSIRFTGEWEGKAYEDKGTVLKFEKEKMLQYDYWSSMSGVEDHPDNYMVITCLLEHANGATKFTIIQDNCRSEQARDHSAENWKMVMDAIKGMLENEK